MSEPFLHCLPIQKFTWICQRYGAEPEYHWHDWNQFNRFFFPNELFLIEYGLNLIHKLLVV